MSSAAVEVRRSRVARWVPPAEGGGRPYAVAAGHVATAVYEIASLPGTDEAASGVLKAALAACDASHAALGLRVLLEPAAPRPLRLFLCARALGDTDASARAAAARAAASVEAACGRALQLAGADDDALDALLSLGWVRSLVEIRRSEFARPGRHDPRYSGFTYAYAPAPLQPARAASARQIWDEALSFARLGRLLVEFTFDPTSPPHHQEREALRVAGALFRRWGRGQTVELPGGVFSDRRSVEFAADGGAAEAAQLLQAYGAELAGGPWFACAVRVLSAADAPPTPAASSLIARVSAGASLCVHPVTRQSSTFEKCLDASRGHYATPAAAAAIWTQPDAPAHLARLHRLFPLELAAALAPLPSLSVEASWDAFRALDIERQPSLTLSDALAAAPRWSQSASDGLEVPVGWITEPDGGGPVASLRFNDDVVHGLVGGATGSGKSVLLHDLILGAASRYSPEELQLYLIDLKQGVEFEAYRALPHVAVLGIEGERNFTVNVLDAICAEMARRNQLFRDKRTSKIAEYRQASGQPLPRILLVIDEFQTLFKPLGPADTCPQRARAALEIIASKGRSVGVHMLLATQSYTDDGGVWLSPNTLENAKLRVCLQLVNPRQAWSLLNREPGDVARLRRAGEGVLEDPTWQGGRHRLFRALYEASEPAYRRRRDEMVRALGQARPGTRPYVFDGGRPPRLAEAAPALSEERIVFGQSLDARGSLVGFEQDEFNPSNVLLCGAQQEALAWMTLSVAACFLQGRDDPRCRVTFGYAMKLPPEVEAALGDLRRASGGRLEVARGLPKVKGALRRAAEPLDGASGDEPAELLVLYGFTRIRELTSTAYPTPDEQGLFRRLLQDGGEANTYTALAATSWAAAREILSTDLLDTFGARVGLTLPGAPGAVGSVDEVTDLPAGYALATFPALSPEVVRFRTFDGVGEWLRSRAANTTEQES